MTETDKWFVIKDENSGRVWKIPAGTKEDEIETLTDYLIDHFGQPIDVIVADGALKDEGDNPGIIVV